MKSLIHGAVVGLAVSGVLLLVLMFSGHLVKPEATPTATPTAVVLEATPSDRPRCEVVNGSLRLVCPAGYMPTVTGTSAWCDRLMRR